MVRSAASVACVRTWQQSSGRAGWDRWSQCRAQQSAALTCATVAVGAAYAARTAMETVSTATDRPHPEPRTNMIVVVSMPDRNRGVPPHAKERELPTDGAVPAQESQRARVERRAASSPPQRVGQVEDRGGSGQARRRVSIPLRFGHEALQAFLGAEHPLLALEREPRRYLSDAQLHAAYRVDLPSRRTLAPAAHHLEQLDFVREPLHPPSPEGYELDAREACDFSPDRPRHQHLVPLRLRGDACRNVDAHP